MKIPLVADLTKKISKDYGVLKEDDGIAYRWGCVRQRCYYYHWWLGRHKAALWPRRLSARGLFVIDDKGILRQITINDLPVGRSVDETLRLVQAFQFTDKNGEGEENPEKQLSFELFISPGMGLDTSLVPLQRLWVGLPVAIRLVYFRLKIAFVRLPSQACMLAFLSPPQRVQSSEAVVYSCGEVFHFPPLVCPAGWKPGSDTIIPDVEKSKTFFSKQNWRGWSFTAFLTLALAFMQEVFTWSSIVQSNMLNPLISVFSS